MRTALLCLLVAAAVLVCVTAPAGAITVPAADSTYIPLTDMLGFNYRILAAKGVIPEVPALPTGSSIPYPRMFSNGNPNANVAGFTDPVLWPSSGGSVNPTQSAELWWGLEYTGGNGPNPLIVSSLLTTNTVLSHIQTLDPCSVTPVFAFDQNQVGQQPKDPNGLLPGWDSGLTVYDRDIWLRGRVILVNPTGIPGGATGLIGLMPSQVNAIIDPLIAAADPRVAVFNMYDNFFNDFPPGWVYLPGIYEIEGIVVDNNVGGNEADWGGYFPTMDLSVYPDWLFFVELQAEFDNNGKEEGYIIGGVGRSYIIPEPLTIVAVLGGVGGLAGYVRKRLA